MMQVQIVEELDLVIILLEKESAGFAVAGLLLVDIFFLEVNLEKELLEVKLKKELLETK